MTRKFLVARAVAVALAAACVVTAIAAAQDDATQMTEAQQEEMRDIQIREARAKLRADELAVAKAERDLIPASGITGDVAIKAGVGHAEGTLLSAASVVESARCVAARFRGAAVDSSPAACPRHGDNPIALPAGQTEVFIVTGDAPLDVAAAQVYRARVSLITAQLTTANQQYDQYCRQAGHNCGGQLEMAGVAAARVPVLLSYLRNTWEFGGVMPTGLDENMMVTAVAEQLLALGRPDLQVMTTQGGASTDVSEQVQRELTALTNLYNRTASDLDRVNRRIHDLTPPEGQQPPPALNEFTALKSDLQRACTTYTDLMKYLFEGGGAGVAPAITAVLRSLSLMQSIGDGARGVLLWIDVNSTVGGYYSQTNVFTWIGFNPMHYAGGSVVSYRATSLADGRYLDAGVVPMFTGHVPAGRVQARVGQAHPQH